MLFRSISARRRCRCRLIALDARTGARVTAFGTNGEVDLGVPYNSVPGIFRNVLIVGANNSPGAIGGIGDPRAYDAKSGAKLWQFHSVPQPGEPGFDARSCRAFPQNFMSEYDEFRELIQQAKAHAQYYQLLGITHIGSTEVGQDDILSYLPKPTEIKTPLIAPSAPAVIIPKAPMPVNDSISLFGEAAEASVANETPNETLDDIRRNLGECQRCKLWSTRTNIVFGEGNAQAQLMFVGEGPGADEDASGRPFIGRAGQLLTKMIEAIELKREDVYIANVVKSRPPNNRAPEADEITACRPFLWRQIAVIKPKLIVTLGNPATQLLLETKIGITQLRGKLQPYARVPGVQVLPTFHPAYLLRSPDKKREAWEDLKKVRAFLRGETE